MIPADWTPHRRDDGEVLGWVRPVHESWIAVDLLGREFGEPGDYLDAEAALEARGLGFLAERWWLGPNPVRIGEVSTEHVVVYRDDYGAASAVGSHATRIELPWPAPPALSQEARHRRTGPERFLRGDGRIDRYPAAPDERDAFLAWIAARTLARDERLGEREITDRLAAAADDPIRLRRELIDRGLLEREIDGASYWLGSGRRLPEG